MPFINSHKRMYQVKEYDKKGISKVNFFETEAEKDNHLEKLKSKKVPHSEFSIETNSMGFLENSTFSSSTAQDPETGTTIIFNKVPKIGEGKQRYYTVDVDYPYLATLCKNSVVQLVNVDLLGLDPSKTFTSRSFYSYSKANKFYVSLQKDIKKLRKKTKEVEEK